MAQQVTTGSVEGTVVDPQGGALPGSTVTIVSREGERTIQADAAGRFRFPYLTPGTYSLKVTLQGYNSAEHAGGAAQIVDLTSTTTGATIPSTVMSSVPRSLVIAKDLFSQFDPSDLLAPEVARRYRDAVLAAGGSAPAAQIVQSFLARPYSFDAYERWLNAG